LKTDLIITTYNWPEALDLVLQSVEHQTIQPGQVIVVDDGSRAITRATIKKWSTRLNIVYVWQRDKGFRAARSRNLGILRLLSPHVVFIDGDCLLPPGFIESHRQLIQPKKIVAGGRRLSTYSETNRLIDCGKISQQSDWLFAGIKFWNLKLGFLRDIWPKKWSLVRTCNVAFWSDDIRQVGGFNEDFEGWGLEDSEIVVRMLGSGCRIRLARYAACVRHLYHAAESRVCLGSNHVLFNRVMRNGFNDTHKTCLGEK